LQTRCGVLADLSPEERADTIIYVDVLEHIEKDEEEMRAAAAHLTTGGLFLLKRYAGTDRVIRRLVVTCVALMIIVMWSEALIANVSSVLTCLERSDIA